MVYAMHAFLAALTTRMHIGLYALVKTKHEHHAAETFVDTHMHVTCMHDDIIYNYISSYIRRELPRFHHVLAWSFTLSRFKFLHCSYCGRYRIYIIYYIYIYIYIMTRMSI